MRKPIIIILLAILIACMFACGYAAGSYRPIINANPWVDTESNTILIDYGGAVHVYEYCEN